MVAAAGISAVAGLGGAFLSSRGASQGARAQVDASNAATAAQQSMFDATRQDLDPFKFQGYNASNWLANLTGIGNNAITPNIDPRNSQLLRSAPAYQRYANFQPSAAYLPVAPYRGVNYNYFKPTMQQLEQTPGYQFTRDQGLKAVTNASSAKGLIGSGAHGKALADYATGLASTTFDRQLQNNINQFNTDLSSRIGQFELGLNANINQYNTAAQNRRQDYATGLDAWTTQYNTGFNSFTQNQNNVWNKLYALLGAGQNAATQTGQLGTQVGGQIGSNLIGAGNASAAGTIGASNAWSNALSGIGNSFGSYMTLNRLLQNNSNPGGGASFFGAYGSPYSAGAGGYGGLGPFI